MSTQVTETKSTRTVALSDPYFHPVKRFLQNCGLDVSGFPRIRFLIEIENRNLTTGRLYLPLRIPGHSGWVFETFYRIIRSQLIPNFQGGGHRQFIELEWHILEAPIVDEEPHQLFPFLSAESLCLKCREVFLVEPEKVGNTTVKIVCPNCLAEWKIESSQPASQTEKVPLLLDEYSKDHDSIVEKAKLLSSGPVDVADANYARYIPVQFENWGEASSLDLLFGDRKGMLAFTNGVDADVNILFRSYLNQITIQGLQYAANQPSLANLENTDIQRKSEITQKIDIPKREPPLPSSDPKGMEFLTGSEEKIVPEIQLYREDLYEKFRPVTKTVEMSWEPTRILKPKKRLAGFAKVATIFISIGLGGLLAYRILGLMNISNPKDLEKMIFQSKTEPVKTRIVKKRPEKRPADLEKASLKTPPAESLKLKATKLAPSEVAATTSLKTEPSLPKKSRAQIEKEAAANKRKSVIESGYRQGMLHLKLQQAKKAAGEFEKVLRLDPGHVDTYRNLGLAYVYEHRFEDAIKAFEKYLSLAGNSFDRDSVKQLLVSLKSR